MLFSTFKADAKLWVSLSRWISPLLSPFPCYPSSTTARRTWLCLSVLQMKKWRHSLHISCWFKPWRGKGRSLKFQNPTLPAVFSIMHLRFFFLVPIIQFVVHGQPFQQEHQEPLKSIWVTTLCAQHQAPTAPTPGIRQTVWRVALWALPQVFTYSLVSAQVLCDFWLKSTEKVVTIAIFTTLDACATSESLLIEILTNTPCESSDFFLYFGGKENSYTSWDFRNMLRSGAFVSRGTLSTAQ